MKFMGIQWFKIMCEVIQKISLDAVNKKIHVNERECIP